MAGFKLDFFLGERPRVDPRLLKDNEAAIARDVKLGSGTIAPVKQPSEVTSLFRPGPNRSIHRFGDGINERWLHWTTDVDAARGPVPGDTLERTYYTGDGAPKFTYLGLVDTGGNDQYPEDWRYVGVPAPGTAPVVTAPAMAGGGAFVGTIRSPSFDIVWDVYPGFEAESTTTINHPTGQNFTAGITAGMEFSVSQIVDVNTVRIKGTSSRGYLASAGAFNAQWRVGTNVNNKPKGTFLLKDESEITITNHALALDDIIRISSVTTPFTYYSTTNVVVSPRNGAMAATGTPFSGTPVEFYGAFAFTVERPNSSVASRSYVYTFVTDLGEEGPPSPQSEIVSAYEGDSVTLGSFAATPNSHINVVSRRIYRSNTGSDDTAFQFVGEVPINSSNFSDDLMNNELGEALPSLLWDGPPADLHSLVAMPNGFLAGASKNQLCLSEQNYPHAWPIDYRKSIDATIVGLGVFGNSILITTDGTPYLATGTTPGNMSLRRISVPYSCVSKRSIANIGDVVLYASPVGLVAAGNSGFSVITQDYLSREQWEALNPSSIDAYVLDKRYLAFYDATSIGGTQGSFMFDPGDESVGLSFLTPWFRGGYTDLGEDRLYVTAGSNIALFGGGTSNYTMQWRSKVFETPRPCNLGCARVLAAAYPVTFALYADGVLRFTRTVTDEEAFRLPSGYLAQRYQIGITGTNEVKSVHVAELIRELAE